VISPSQRPLPTHDNTPYKHKRQTSMPRTGFESAIPATKRPQTYAYGAANGIGSNMIHCTLISVLKILRRITYFNFAFSRAAYATHISLCNMRVLETRLREPSVSARAKHMRFLHSRCHYCSFIFYMPLLRFYFSIQIRLLQASEFVWPFHYAWINTDGNGWTCRKM
jgi:hypothetical protein